MFKIKEGTVKNINKKLIAGALALTLITTGLAGCSSIDDIKYTTNESGYIESIDGNVSYKTLQSCGFYEIKNNITEEEYYTILLYDNSLDNPAFLYDIFTRQAVSTGDFAHKLIDSVEDYLISFKMVKEQYTEQDLNEILDKFIDIQEKRNNKQLVKEK